MIGQYLPQTNEKCYTVLQWLMWFFLPLFSHLNTALALGTKRDHVSHPSDAAGCWDFTSCRTGDVVVCASSCMPVHAPPWREVCWCFPCPGLNEWTVRARPLAHPWSSWNEILPNDYSGGKGESELVGYIAWNRLFLEAMYRTYTKFLPLHASCRDDIRRSNCHYPKNTHSFTAVIPVMALAGINVQI